MMTRRELMALIAGAAAPALAWPLAARGQQAGLPLIGFVSAGSLGSLHRQIAAFREGLKEQGFVEGHNVTVEYRSADGQLDRFPGLASELVRRQAAVLFVTSSAGALALKQATSTIPIVFSIGEDPVRLGLVAGLNRPGGNMTGIYQFTTGLEAKRLGLLHEMVPNATTIAVLVNASFSAAESQLRDVRAAADQLRVQLVVLRADVASDFDTAFATLVRQRAGALQVCGSPFFNTRREQLVVLAARHAVPAIYEWRDYAAAGGLMSYGTHLAEAYRQAGVYAGRILKGTKPADLPAVQSTKFELVINLSTAKAIGLDVPASLLARADEVIE
jgi:putative ABC transport system substrate-binding protein